MTPCQWCGRSHDAVCPTIKAFEYHPDGSIKRVEFKTAADYAPFPQLPLQYRQAGEITQPAPFRQQATWISPFIAQGMGGGACTGEILQNAIPRHNGVTL